MTASMKASLSAIGLQLRAAYVPAVGKPLPRELNDLLARLVALEAGTHGSTERAIEILQPAIVPLPSGTNDYLLAHQGFSPRASLQGMAPYVRTVSDSAQESTK